MRRFLFGMEKLLRFREHEERLAQNSLATANARCLMIEGEIAQAREYMLSAVSTVVSTGTIDVGGYLAGAVYAAALEGRISELQNLLQKAEDARDTAAEGYRYYHRRASALQLLRGRRFDAWRRDYRRYETKLLDDISQIRSAAEPTEAIENHDREGAAI